MEIISVVPKDIEVTVVFTHTDMKAIYSVLDNSIIHDRCSGIPPESFDMYKAFFALLENCVAESDPDGP